MIELYIFNNDTHKLLAISIFFVIIKLIDNILLIIVFLDFVHFFFWI